MQLSCCHAAPAIADLWRMILFISALLRSLYGTSNSNSAVWNQEISLTVVAAIATGLFLWGGSNALAVDALKTCGCLLKECR